MSENTIVVLGMVIVAGIIITIAYVYNTYFKDDDDDESVNESTNESDEVSSFKTDWWENIGVVRFIQDIIKLFKVLGTGDLPVSISIPKRKPKLSVREQRNKKLREAGISEKDVVDAIRNFRKSGMTEPFTISKAKETDLIERTNTLRKENLKKRQEVYDDMYPSITLNRNTIEHIWQDTMDDSLMVQRVLYPPTEYTYIQDMDWRYNPMREKRQYHFSVVKK